MKSHGIPCRKVTDEASLQETKAVTALWDKGVVLLVPDMGYGTDIRFKSHPRCVVFSKDPISNYDFLQFAGRAQRANVRTECTLFTLGDPGQGRQRAEQFKVVDQQPFGGGKLNLAALREFATKAAMPSLGLGSLFPDKTRMVENAPWKGALGDLQTYL